MGRWLPVVLFVVAGAAGWLIVLAMPAPGDQGPGEPEPAPKLAAPKIKLSDKVAPKPKEAEPAPAVPKVAEQEPEEAPTPPPPGDPMEMTKEQRLEQLKAMLKIPPHMQNSERSEQRKYFENLLENQQSVVQRFQERVMEFEGRRAELTGNEERDYDRTRFNVTMFEESIELLEQHLDDWED